MTARRCTALSFRSPAIIARRGGRGIGERADPAAANYSAAESPERVQDHGDVDRLLEERPEDGLDVAERGEHHGDETEPDAGDDALAGDRQRPPADADGVAHPVDPVDEDDRVGGL